MTWQRSRKNAAERGRTRAERELFEFHGGLAARGSLPRLGLIAHAAICVLGYSALLDAQHRVCGSIRTRRHLFSSGFAHIDVHLIRCLPHGHFCQLGRRCMPHAATLAAVATRRRSLISIATRHRIAAVLHTRSRRYTLALIATHGPSLAAIATRRPIAASGATLHAHGRHFTLPYAPTDC